MCMTAYLCRWACWRWLTHTFLVKQPLEHIHLNQQKWAGPQLVCSCLTWDNCVPLCPANYPQSDTGSDQQDADTMSSVTTTTEQLAEAGGSGFRLDGWMMDGQMNGWMEKC